jgi:hypothetical protein
MEEPAEEEEGSVGSNINPNPLDVTCCSLLDDLSMLEQQSQAELYDDSSVNNNNTSALQTYGMEDLSCSLVHCGGGDNDNNGSGDDFTVRMD